MAKKGTEEAAANGEKKKRKAVEKLPPGTVRVGVETFHLSQEEAEAAALEQGGAVPEDQREIAALARDWVRDIVDKEVAERLARAVDELRGQRHAVALAAAERRAAEAASELDKLRSEGPVLLSSSAPAGDDGANREA